MDATGRTLKRQSGHTRTHVTAERWVDAPLTPEAWEEAVAELQGRHGVDASFWMGQNSGGTVQTVSNAYEWRHTSSLGVQTVVTASPRGDRTRLRLRQLVGLASPTAEGVGYGLVVALVAAPFGGWAADAVWAAALAFLAVWLVATPLITALDRRWRARRLDDLGALADDLASLLAASPGTPERLAGAEPLEGGAAPRDRLPLDLGPLGDDPVTATAGPRRVRER